MERSNQNYKAMTRAKFKCVSKEEVQNNSYDYRADEVTDRPAAKIVLMAVVGSEGENKETPNGNITLDIVNLDAAEMFEPGKEYYVDFTAAH